MAGDDEVVEAGNEQAEEIETLRKALAEEREKTNKYLANWQRSQADLENYVKRAEREKAEMVESANRLLVLDLLPVLDDFERALASLPPDIGEQKWTEGVRLIYNKLRSVLETQGLAEIQAKGECFDPYLHEAVGQADGDEGVVTEEVRKGYKFKDKLLRPSMVMVGKGNTDKAEQRSPEEE